MQQVDAGQLQSGDEFIAPVTILDADGCVVRIVSAEEFRRTHATVVSAPLTVALRRGRRRPGEPRA